MAQILTGRYPSQPNMQNLRPPLTPEQRAMVDNIKRALWENMK